MYQALPTKDPASYISTTICSKEKPKLKLLNIYCKLFVKTTRCATVFGISLFKDPLSLNCFSNKELAIAFKESCINKAYNQ